MVFYEQKIPSEMEVAACYTLASEQNVGVGEWQGGITCGAIDEPRKSSKAIDERAIINFRDKNVVIARFATKMGVLSYIYIYMFYR